jgi:hypothetical protein
LLARRSAPPRAGALGALAFALVLALLPTWADYRLANSARAAALRIAEEPRGDGTLWFTGHWGFQYYMEEQGAEALPVDSVEIEKGDILVAPSNNTNLFAFPAEALEEAGSLRFLPSPWLSTMDSGRAGFYTDVWGPMPYAFGPPRPETYEVHRVVQGLRPRR